MFLLMKGRRIRAHLMRTGHGFTFRREHPDRRPAARLDLIHQFVKIHPKKKGDKLSDEQKLKKKDLAKRLSDMPWVDENGKVVTDKKTLERIKSLKVNNPAVVDVRIAADPDDDPQAIVWYINMHGEKKKNYIYTTNHNSESSDAKWVRCAKLSKIYDQVRDVVVNEAGEGVEEAIILHLMFLTNMRVGNTADMKTKVKAYGATTLQARHLKVEGDTIIYRFVGKSGVLWNGRVRDAVLANAIQERLEGKERRERVFSANGVDVNRYFSQAGDFSARDVRPLHGTAYAKDLLKKAPKPRNLKSAKKLVKEICAKTAKILHHDSPNTTKTKYIDPIVWAEIEERFGIKFLKPKV